MTSLSHKVRQRIWGYAKRNKKYIPKEGMPHASAWSKIKDAYPKKVCHMPTSHVKKKIAPIQRKKKKQERWFIQRSSSIIHHPPKNTHIYTLAHLDQGLWLVSSLDPIFNLATYEEHVCLQLSPCPELHIKAFLEVGEKEGNNLPLWGNQKPKREI